MKPHPKSQNALAKHCRRIARIKTAATRAARSRNMKLANRTRILMLAGIPKKQALEKARKELANAQVELRKGARQ